jgi:PAS domain S-box-containing protein
MLLLLPAVLAVGYAWRVRSWQRRSRELERTVAERTVELNERVKELDCLLGISDLVERPDITLEGIVQGTVDLLPPAWRFPERTCARIILESERYTTENWQALSSREDAACMLARDVYAHSKHVGQVEVCTLPGQGNGAEPFLREEKLLLAAVAARLGRIVERVRAQEELERSQEQYALAQRAAGIGIWDWDLVTGTIYWSEEVAPIFGFGPEGPELVPGLGPEGFEKVHSAFFRTVHPEDRAYVADAVRGCLAQGAYVSIEHRVVWPDESIRWVAETGDVIRDEEGRATRMLGVVRDITERRRVEDELRASEEEYRDLVENISDVIYAMDIEGQLTYVSPVIESFLGYTVEEAVGGPFLGMIHPEDLARARANLGALVEGQSLRSNEYRAVTRSGEMRWMRVSGQPILKGGETTGVLGVLTDITDRVQAREQAARMAAVAERERLARDLHDAVTQTLFSASSIASVLPEVWERHPEEARRGLEELRRLTRGALAEMRALLLELRPASLLRRSLGELLRQLVDAMMSRTQSEIELTVTGERELPDEVQIAFYRIAQEALNNAVRHAQASHVAMDLYSGPDRVTLCVRDDGRGFDLAEVGSGSMGLGIMRERAAGIGAQFKLHSAPGEGAEITVTWHDPESET